MALEEFIKSARRRWNEAEVDLVDFQIEMQIELSRCFFSQIPQETHFTDKNYSEAEIRSVFHSK